MYLIYLLKVLFIYLISYNFKFVISAGNENQYIDFNKFKIITLNNDGSYSVNDNTKYRYNIDYTQFDTAQYSFDNWSKCVKVMYGDDVIWSINGQNDYPIKITIYYYLNGLDLDFDDSYYYYDLIRGKWSLLNIVKYESEMSHQLSYKEVKPLLVESGLMNDSHLDYVLAFGVLFLLMSLVMSTGLTVNYFKSKGLNKLKSTSVTVV